MPTDPNNPNTRPAQILLGERDRKLNTDLMRRAAARGVRVTGPTVIYRAGLLALTNLSDTELIIMFDEADDRPSAAQLQERFCEWCREIWKRICATSPSLQYCWRGERDPEQVGHFGQDTRFVHLGLMHDGRVLISGLEAVTQPLQPGQRIPHSPALFPGGLATMLSMTDDGADLAARAITTWLLNNNDELEDVRDAVRRHQAEPLR